MKSTTQKNQTYIAFLRGINVGGHHKLPMADLCNTLAKMGFTNVITLLNSGNVIFDGIEEEEAKLEERISSQLEETFNFPVPVLLRTREELYELVELQPFNDIEVTKDIRLYVSFLKQKPEVNLDLPWVSEDGSFHIIDIQNRSICSVLDLSVAKTVKGMDALEKLFGKEITTRNWNTLNRITDKLDK